MRGPRFRWGRPGSELAISLGLACVALAFWKFQLFDPPTGHDYEFAPFRAGDFLAEILPLTRESVRQLLDGELPLWNPYQYSGRPLLATPTTSALYPFNFPYLFLPTPVAIEVILVLHLAAAGVFTYAFARSITLSPLASISSGLCFMLSGFVAGLAAWSSLALASAVWLPLALLAVERLVAGPRAKWVAVLALAVCMPLLAGWIQIWTYSMYALALYASLRLVLRERATRDRRRDALIFASLAVGVALGIGMAAVQILPSQELRSLSTRPGELTASYAIPLGQLPLSHVVKEMSAPKAGWPRWPYLGIATLVLLPLSLFARGRRVQILCFGMLGLSALGNVVLLDVYEILRLLPGVSWFRFPSRMLFLYAFGGAILVGAAIDDLRRGAQLPRTAALAALVVAAAAALQTFTPIGGLHLAALWFAVVLVCGALLAPSGWLRSGALLALVVLLAADLFLSSQSIYHRPVHIPHIIEVESDVYAYLREHQGYGRSLIASLKPGALGNRPTGEGVYSITDYESLTLARFGTFFARIDRRNLESGRVPFSGGLQPDPFSPQLRMLELMSLRYLVARPAEVGRLHRGLGRRAGPWRVVYVGHEEFVVFENPRPLPRAYIAFDSVAVVDGAAALDAVSDPFFPFRQKVVIEGIELDSERAEPRSILPAQIIAYRASEVTIETNADEAGHLVLTDTYYPGWTAEIDGRPSEIRPANYLFRAVAIPAGPHRVTFRYESRSVRIGGAISLGSLAVLAAAVGAGRVGSHRLRTGLGRG